MLLWAAVWAVPFQIIHAVTDGTNGGVVGPYGRDGDISYTLDSRYRAIRHSLPSDLFSAIPVEGIHRPTDVCGDIPPTCKNGRPQGKTCYPLPHVPHRPFLIHPSLLIRSKSLQSAVGVWLCVWWVGVRLGWRRGMHIVHLMGFIGLFCGRCVRRCIHRLVRWRTRCYGRYLWVWGGFRGRRYMWSYKVLRGRCLKRECGVAMWCGCAWGEHWMRRCGLKEESGEVKSTD